MIYLSTYYRSTSNFNPTISRADWLTNPYDYDKQIAAGVLKSTLKSDTKYKFMSYNATLIINGFHFIENTFALTTTNALFMPGYGEYRWINITNCKFNLRVQLMVALLGTNIYIFQSYINITLMNRVGLFAASKDCIDMMTPFSMNNFIMDSSTVTGFNQQGYTYVFYWQNHYNITFTNNIIYDFQWPLTTLSINARHYDLNCPGIQPVTIQKVQNNTFYNKDPSIVSGFYFQMVFTTLGIQKSYFQNNSFINMTFWDTSLILTAKTGLVGLETVIEDIYFENVLNKQYQIPFISTSSSKAIIRNITSKNCQVLRFIALECQNTTVSDIKLINVSGQCNFSPYVQCVHLDNSSFANGFFEIQYSDNVTLKNIYTSNIKLANSKLITVLSSTNIFISDVHTYDSEIANNHYMYMSQSRNVSISNVRISNVQKVVSTAIYGFMIYNLEPHYSYTDPAPALFYNLTNITLANSSFEFFNIENIILNQDLMQGGYSYPGNMFIQLDKILIDNVILTQQENMFSIKAITYNQLQVIINNTQILSSQLDTGYFFSFEQNTEMVGIINLIFQNNTGFMLLMNPSDTFNTNQPQKINIEKSYIKNNYAGPLALIQYSSNSRLTVQSCIFEDNYSVGLGSIIFAQNENSKSTLIDTVISRNYAYFGGAFFSQQGSMITCIRCQIQNNFAVIGGVSYSQNFGYIIYKNSSISLNKALINSVIFAINSQNTLEVQGGQIFQNGITYNQTWLDNLKLFARIENQNARQQLASSLGLYIAYLEYLNDNYQSQIIQASLLDPYSQNPQISIIKAMISFSQGLLVNDQILFLEASSASDVQVNDMSFQNITNISSSLMVIGESTASLQGLLIKNISTTNYMISCISQSAITISNSEILQTEGPFLFISQTVLTGTRINIHNIKHNSQQLPIIGSLKSQILFTNLSISSVSSNHNLKEIISLDYSTSTFHNTKVKQFESQFMQTISGKLTIQACYFGDGQQLQNDAGLALRLISTTANISDSVFENLQGMSAPCIHVFDKYSVSAFQQIRISNNSFTNNVAQIQGGAISLQNYDGEITNNTFESNYALMESGGAIQLSCSSIRSKSCDFNMVGNNFTSNQASKNGGGVYFDLYSPKNLAKNYFENNLAQYGNNFASYPFKMKIINSSSLRQFASGQMVSLPIQIGIYDQNDQLINNDNSSEALLTSNDLRVVVSQNNKVVAVNGIFSFTNITLIAKPSYLTSIKFVTGNIDHTLYKLASNETYKGNALRVLTEVLQILKFQFHSDSASKERSLRIISALSALEEPILLMKQASACFANAICSSKNHTVVEPGYWRIHNESVVLYQCPNPLSCLGGINSDCAVGYEGILCQVCSQEVNGTRYSKQGSKDCIVCEKLHIQIMKFISILFGIAIYVCYLLFSLLNNPRRSKPQAVLIRILTSYFHAIFIVKDFDLDWPTQVQNTLDSISFVASSTQTVFSFDCFFQFSDHLEMPPFYIKLLIFGTLPLSLSIVAAGVWLLIFSIQQRRGKQVSLGHSIQVTSFIFCYLCYPIITNQNFSAFSCQSFNDGKSYLKSDFSIECWTEQHTKYSLAISVPLIAIWTIGFPLSIFYILRSNQREFYNLKFISKFGLFFIGLKDNSYFWEIVVVNGRKMIFIVCQTLLFFLPQEIKALIGMFILLTQIQLLDHQKPYIDSRFNQIEKYSIYSAVLVLYGGIFFTQSEVKKNDNFLFALFLMILFFNMQFMISWCYRFFSILFRIHQSLLKKLPFCWFLKKYQISDYETELEYLEKSKKGKKFMLTHLSLNSFYENTNAQQRKDNSLSIRQINDTKSFRSQSIMESDRAFLTKHSKMTQQNQKSILQKTYGKSPILQKQVQRKDQWPQQTSEISVTPSRRGFLGQVGLQDQESQKSALTLISMTSPYKGKRATAGFAEHAISVLDASQISIDQQEDNNINAQDFVKTKNKKRQKNMQKGKKPMKRGVFKETDVGLTQINSRLVDQSSISNSALDRTFNPHKHSENKMTHVPTFCNFPHKEEQEEDQQSSKLKQMGDQQKIIEDPFAKSIDSPPSFSQHYDSSQTKIQKPLPLEQDTNFPQNIKKAQKSKHATKTLGLNQNLSSMQISSNNSQASLQKLVKKERGSNKAHKLFKQLSQVVKFKSRSTKPVSAQNLVQTLNITTDEKYRIKEKKPMQKEKEADLQFELVMQISFLKSKSQNELQNGNSSTQKESDKALDQENAVVKNEYIQSLGEGGGWDQLRKTSARKQLQRANDRYQVQQQNESSSNKLQSEHKFQPEEIVQQRSGQFESSRKRKNIVIKIEDQEYLPPSYRQSDKNLSGEQLIDIDDYNQKHLSRYNTRRPQMNKLDINKVQQLQFLNGQKLKQQQQLLLQQQKNAFEVNGQPQLVQYTKKEHKQDPSIQEQ